MKRQVTCNCDYNYWQKNGSFELLISIKKEKKKNLTELITDEEMPNQKQRPSFFSLIKSEVTYTVRDNGETQHSQRQLIILPTHICQKSDAETIIHHLIYFAFSKTTFYLWECYCSRQQPK